MCGIVGYLGKENGVSIVLDGLRRLEYRGYDSAGICFEEKKSLRTLKKEGQISNLEKLVNESSVVTKKIIGHTRWATHGKVTSDNAHPHGNDKLSLVHNGIIENSIELKETLLKEGADFKSETDSEVFFQLIWSRYKNGGDLKTILRETFKMLKGNSSFVIIDNDTDSMYGIKSVAPLVCGKSRNGNLMLSSDPYALFGYVDEIYFPGDGVLCELSNKDIDFYDLEGNKTSNFFTQKAKGSSEVSTKGGFDHFMMKEIHEQPDLINNLLDKFHTSQVISKLETIGEKIKKASNVHISACGTAFYAGLMLKYYIERNNNIAVNVELASEFRYRNPVICKGDVAISISQSGETIDTLASLQLCKEKGLHCYSIINTEGSTIFRECEENLLIYAGKEIGVASTKAFTLQVLSGYLLSHHINGGITDTISKNVRALSKTIQDILDRKEELKDAAREYVSHRGYIFTGRGLLFPIALEGALKLKEIAYVHAEGYAAGELKHGPIALIDSGMVNVVFSSNELQEKTLSNAEEVKARNGVLLGVGDISDRDLLATCDKYFGFDMKELGDLSGLAINVVSQLFSYYIAQLKGHDIDKPRNLAKSVTVE